jgi:cobyrinic acid a,c-diamide synthase
MPPRLVVAGLAGESGKTLVSLALLIEAARRGIPTRAFKKGPDYIDAAWLAWASGTAARNLDTYLMGFTGAAGLFARHALRNGFNLIEGNRGLYDGVDSAGTHSTAELAKTLDAPVLLAVNATKVTRTVAAMVLGCQRLDPAVRIAGVVLNQVCGARHERVLRESIESVCGIPVLGAIPRAKQTPLPSRHLGLVTPAEHPETEALENGLLNLTRGRLDFDRILEIARQAPALTMPLVAPPHLDGRGLRIGYLRDSAFTFYYPDNLEALADAGAVLEPISSQSAALPASIDGLYIGGGFPETHAQALASNESFLASLRDAARSGLPIYAECGGLMLLARAILWGGARYPMAGVFPFEVEVCATHQGHGYVELQVDRPNPFFPVGARLRGHEFHYSRIRAGHAEPETACAVRRGTGCGGGRDAVIVENVWASYTHLHAAATPNWAERFLAAIRRRRLPPFPPDNARPAPLFLPA